jgi:hypothetical protein
LLIEFPISDALLSFRHLNGHGLPAPRSAIQILSPARCGRRVQSFLMTLTPAGRVGLVRLAAKLVAAPKLEQFA